MKTVMIAAAIAATFASGSAMAQAGAGSFKEGTTRDAALAAAAKGFKHLDANADGAFDSAEATTLLTARAAKKGKTFRPRRAERMVSASDTDGDGKVTLAEFQAAAGARFDTADANKNGVIDADEAKGGKNAGDDDGA